MYDVCLVGCLYAQQAVVPQVVAAHAGGVGTHCAEHAHGTVGICVAQAVGSDKPRGIAVAHTRVHG